MAPKRTGIIGISDNIAGENDNFLPGARCAKPGPIGLDGQDDANPLQTKPGTTGSSPQIKIKVTSDGTRPIPDLKCTLTVGSSPSKTVTTDKHGFVSSSDRTGGAVTIATKEKLLKISSDATPTATLSVTKQSPVRGAEATIAITPPKGLFGFQVTEWTYEISHTNPGDHSASTTTVTRPANESPPTEWKGI